MSTQLILASQFWADWDRLSAPPHSIRRDTRIFWGPQPSGAVGRCVGTFIEENPGGADSVFGASHNGPSPVIHKRLPGDPTMRLIFEVWAAAIRSGLNRPEANDYIEVLNTYYFRNPASGGSLAAWRATQGSSLYSPVPSPSARFVLLGWGVSHTTSLEALSAARSLSAHSRVIIPDSRGKVAVVHGATLVHGVDPGPVTPSYVLMKSKRLKPTYIENVAREFR